MNARTPQTLSLLNTSSYYFQASSSWFLSVTAARKKNVNNNEKMNESSIIIIIINNSCCLWKTNKIQKKKFSFFSEKSFPEQKKNEYIDEWWSWESLYVCQCVIITIVIYPLIHHHRNRCFHRIIIHIC